MRSLWKGAISFGLVNIPIKLYKATEDKSISFKFLHNECKTPIRYEKVCPACQKEVSNDEIVRGYEYEKGRYVTLTNEDLDHLPLETLRTIQILDFVNLEEIDPIFFQRTYIAAPGEFGVKPYNLLYRTLKESQKIAIAKVVLRTKENLAALRVYENCILVITMYYADEVRMTKQIPELAQEEINLHPNELKMAKSLVDNLTAKFEPQKYASKYREALHKMIESKIQNEEVEIPEIRRDEKVVDLLEALRESVKATKPSKNKTRKKKAAQDT